MSHHVLFPAYNRGEENPPIDRKVLNDLRAVLGEEGSNKLTELIDLFLADVPCRLSEIRRMSRKGSWKKIANSVKALRGWCETLGACEMAYALKKMELFLEKIALDSEAGIDREEFFRLIDETEEDYARAASALLISTAEY